MSESFVTTITLRTGSEKTVTYTHPSTAATPPQVRAVYPGRGYVEVAFTEAVIENGTLVPARNIQVEPNRDFGGRIPPKTNVTISVRRV